MSAQQHSNSTNGSTTGSLTPSPLSSTCGGSLSLDQPKQLALALSTSTPPVTYNDHVDAYLRHALQAIPQQPRYSHTDEHSPDEPDCSPPRFYFDTNVSKPENAPPYWTELNRLVGVLFSTTPAGYPPLVSLARIEQEVYVRLPSNHLRDTHRYEPAIVQAALTNQVYMVKVRDNYILYVHISCLRQRHAEHTRPFEILIAADKLDEEASQAEVLTCPCKFRKIHDIDDLTVFGTWLVIQDQDEHRHWVSLAQSNGDWTPLETLIASFPLEGTYDRSIRLVEVALSKKRARQLIERLQRVTRVKVIIFPLDKQFRFQQCAQDFINLLHAYPLLEDAYNLPNIGCVPDLMLSHYTDFSYRHIAPTSTSMISDDYRMLSVRYDVEDDPRPSLFLETNAMDGFLTEVNNSIMRLSTQRCMIYAHNSNFHFIDQFLSHLRLLDSWPSLTRVTLRIHISLDVPNILLDSFENISHFAQEYAKCHLPVVAALRTWLSFQTGKINYHVTVCADLQASQITPETEALVTVILSHLPLCSRLPVNPNEFAHNAFAAIDGPNSTPPEFFPAGHRLRQRLMLHKGYEYPSDKPQFTTKTKDEQLLQQLDFEKRLRA